MENLSVTHQFILYRAHGASLGRIKEELGYSKATFSGWDEKYATEIAQLKADNFEELRQASRALAREKFDAVIQALRQLYQSGKLNPALLDTINSLFKISDEIASEVLVIPEESNKYL